MIGSIRPLGSNEPPLGEIVDAVSSDKNDPRTEKTSEGFPNTEKLRWWQYLFRMLRMRREIWREIADLITRKREGETPAHKLTSTEDLDRGKLSHWVEHREKIEQLKLHELTIDPEETVQASRMMKLLEELYTLNLISDEDFYNMLQGMPVSRWGMANLFQPPPDILKHYPKGYETVRDQVFADLTGRSGRPGTYRCFALHRDNDPHAALVAYLTLRQPPRGDEREVRRYIDHLTNVHREKDDAGRDRMTFDAGIKQSTFNRLYPTMVEIDTINAHPDPQWAGADIWLMLLVLLKLAEEEDIGKGHICYHQSVGFCTPSPNPAVLPSFGRSMQSYYEHPFLCFALVDYATRCEEREVVVREVPNMGIIKLQPRWKYGFQEIEIAVEYGEGKWSAFVPAE